MRTRRTVATKLGELGVCRTAAPARMVGQGAHREWEPRQLVDERRSEPFGGAGGSDDGGAGGADDFDRQVGVVGVPYRVGTVVAEDAGDFSRRPRHHEQRKLELPGQACLQIVRVPGDVQPY